MIADLKPYPGYKDSGLSWLRMVPEHWDIKRAKNILRAIDIRSESGEEELLTVSSEKGVVPRRSTTVTMFKAESYVGHKLCWPGDIVINSLWAWARGLGVTKIHGIVSSAYGVYRPKSKIEIEPQYIHELIRSAPFHWELRVRSKGVWTSRLQLTDDSFLDAPIPLPPITEQSSIVRFLKHANQRIRRYIRAKQKLIKLLKEQKQVIIHRAVTRGIDPNVRLKPSGIEWLGDVPEHWDIRKLKRIARLNPSRTESAHLRESNELATFLPMERVSTRGEVDPSLQFPIRDIWQGFTYFRRGDVLLAKITPCFENGKGACLTTLPTEIGFGTTEFIVLRAGKLILPEFLYQLIHLAVFRDMGIESMTGSAGQQRVSLDFVANFELPLQPIEEQKMILKEILGITKQIDSTISHTLDEISLLREYHTRLIADVVTGKLDVRDAASRLSEEFEEPEIQDNEPLVDENEIIEGDMDVVTEETEA